MTVTPRRLPFKDKSELLETIKNTANGQKTTTINWKDQLVRPLPTIVALSKRDCPRGKYTLRNEEFTTFVFLPYD